MNMVCHLRNFEILINLEPEETPTKRRRRKSDDSKKSKKKSHKKKKHKSKQKRKKSKVKMNSIFEINSELNTNQFQSDQIVN